MEKMRVSFSKLYILIYDIRIDYQSINVNMSILFIHVDSERVYYYLFNFH